MSSSPVTPSRRKRRAFFRHQAPPGTRWNQTQLCRPNPRAGELLISIGLDGKPVTRACVLGGYYDGVPSQIAGARDRYIPAPSAHPATPVTDARRRRARGAERNFATGHWQHRVIDAVKA